MAALQYAECLERFLCESASASTWTSKQLQVNRKILSSVETSIARVVCDAVVLCALLQKNVVQHMLTTLGRVDVDKDMRGMYNTDSFHPILRRSSSIEES